MTPRMVAAVANPHVDVLGHCTGRMVMARGGGEGPGRPESEFDAEIVFEACRQFGVAVEINCRPERLDPPRRLLELAVATGCLFSIDTDAHAPGQLEWQAYGCDRAAAVRRRPGPGHQHLAAGRPARPRPPPPVTASGNGDRPRRC